MLYSIQCFPLDDTHRNGWLEDDESHQYSAVYTALSSSSSSPAVREAALYLSIEQHIVAPELTDPPRMPHCISSSKLSKALDVAINVKYAGQLTMNASIDTTYVQMLTKCDYSSFITLSGPEEVKSQLVDAANANKLCELLPGYCKALNLVPAAPSPSVVQQIHKPAAASTTSDGTSSSSTTPATAAATTPDAAKPPQQQQPASTPIDSTQQQQHRGAQRLRRRRSSGIVGSADSSDPYVLQSSSGSADPPLPPVLDFKCVKHNFTQVLDHFAERHSHEDHWWHRMFGGDGDDEEQEEEEGDSGSGYYHNRGYPSGGRAEGAVSAEAAGPTASASEQRRRRLQELESKTFQQVYWVCDAAWPKSHSEQKHSGNVIVFLGNESPLGIPKQPIVFENARRLNALVILVEHRYYGESTPYPEPEDKRVPTKDYKWLTIEQVIEDTATVVQHVRKQRGVPAAVPSIVIGGSYGGMIASYHRVVRPDVFDAAVAASAPIYYIVDTKMWRHTANRYHQFIEDAADTMSGSNQCSSTVRAGLEELLKLGESVAGREEIVKVMGLCGSGTSTLPNMDYVLALQGDVIGTFQGLAQVNNQPPVLGELAIACSVINNATDAGRAPLAAIADLFSYMASNGSSNWCYNFTYDPRFPVLPDVPTGFNSYTYQCCREGTVYSSELPARGSDDSVLNPERIPVPVKEIEENCRNIFGEHMPELRGPGFARHIMPLLKDIGGVVFTNGALDGWAGGSLGLLPNTAGEITHSLPSSQQQAAVKPASDESLDAPDNANFNRRHGGGQKQKEDEAAAVGGLMHELFVGDLDSPTGGLSKRHSNIAFVVYKNASHCTDTHTDMWAANEPPAWKEQRALAMDLAVRFARQRPPYIYYSHAVHRRRHS